MKKIYCLVCCVIVSFALFAQAPESFSYQAVVRDSANMPKANSTVSIRISILQGSAESSVVYSETHTVTTDANGMFSLAIGTGNVVNGAFADIDWGTATYYLKSETDLDGGSNYTLTTTQQLVSVPYALYAKNAGNTISAEEIQQMLDNLRDELDNTIDSLNEEIDNLTEELGSPCPGTVTDDEGNTYSTVKLGRQCWMAENLRSKMLYGWPLECGDTIENTSVNGSFYFSSGDVSKTGYQYTSYAATFGVNSSSVPSNVQGICPAGWHLPSMAEWSQLFSYVGGNSSYCCSSNPSYIAKALASRVGWSYSSNTCAIGNWPEYNNATGFNVRPDNYATGELDEWGNAIMVTGPVGFLTSDPSYVYFFEGSPTVEIASGTGPSEGFVRCVYGSGNTSDPDHAASQGTAPTVITGAVSNVAARSATVEGSVTDNGTTVTERGFCWSSSNQMPTIYDNHSAQGNGIGSLTANLDNLTPATTYYVRVYATNSVGTNYGSVVTFTTVSAPCLGSETLTDIDGNVYNTVQIGSQCWMKENLRATKYANGTPISVGDDSYSTSIACYYYPDNDAGNVTDYGLLYNWKAAMGGSSSSVSNPSGVQGICPIGWHLPSAAEWSQLVSGVTPLEVNNCGNAKKFASQTGWNSYNYWCAVGYDLSANNATGFSAMPAGSCQTSWSSGSGYSYTISGKGDRTEFLCATQDKCYTLYKSSQTFYTQGMTRFGSVRCVKD